MKKIYLEYEGYLTNSIEETINSYDRLLRIERLKKILNIING